MGLSSLLMLANLSALVSSPAFAQGNQSQREWEHKEKLESEAYNNGADLTPSDAHLRAVVENALLSTLKDSILTADQIVDKVIAEATRQGHPNPKMKFRHFKSRIEEHPYCWQVLADNEDAEQIFTEAYEDMLINNSSYVECTLFPNSRGLLTSRCILPVFSKEIPYQDVVTRKKLHLWQWKECTSQNKCGGYKRETGYKRKFAPWREEAFVRFKDTVQDQWLQVETKPIRIDLEAVVARYRERTLKKIQDLANEGVDVARKNFDDAIKKAKDKANQAQVFAPPQEKKFAFLVDNSGSIQSVRDAAIDSMKSTISNLEPDQNFTIVFITDTLTYFNDGKLIAATPANKKAALEYLEGIRSTACGGNEVFDQAINTILAKNGKLEAFYFFGDGAWPDTTKANNLQYARTGKTPINVRAMGSADGSFLGQVAKLSGGTYNDKPFDPNQMRISAEEMAKLNKEIKQVEKERAEKIKQLEKARDDEVARQKERLDEVIRKFRAEDGKCPPVAARNVWSSRRSIQAVDHPTK